MKDFSKKIIIGNWKMNLDIKSSVVLAKNISQGVSKIKTSHEVAILPDFLSLLEVSRGLNKKILYGSQDVSPFSSGAYTGEVSLESLSKIGCNLVLIGHSERRQYFFDETLIADKMKNVLENSKITPILCVGETWGQRKAGQTLKVINKQIKLAFSKIKTLKDKKIIIAYEPIWAIGSGKMVLVDEAVLVHKEIKKNIYRNFKNNLPSELRVIYGGSVNLTNFLDFKNQPDISGFLIGGSSLKPLDFIKIINKF
ncbi:MAG TPA: triose-phosphate isomerase [bacterium]|nr:triose-phosphate isomerase [bacterium]